MRTDKETRELQAIWEFLYDLAAVMAGSTMTAEELEHLKTDIKDTAAAYGTKL